VFWVIRSLSSWRVSYGLRVYDVYSIKNEKSILGHKIIICSTNGLCVKGFKFKVYNVYSIKKTLWVIRSLFIWRVRYGLRV
jgi:hypothetical protein